VGDFNGDGIVDLAVIYTGYNNVIVALGNGDGTFITLASGPATGNGPNAIAVGDFNGDGKMDLAVTNGQDNTVSVVLGNGDGTFTAVAVSPATGRSPSGIAAGDFNGDGKMDLAFATLYPKRYDEIARMVSERAPHRDVFLQKVIDEVYADLRDAKLKARVTGRPKHYYSVYQKMIARNVSFDEIYDLVGIRVLVDSVRDCYAVLGTVHARWNPIPGRFKDYIAMPKFNMYQSLHTTVIGPEGNPVELQIRTWGMHRRSEYGVAAHWKYKEETVPRGRGDTPNVSEMAWLRQLVDWQRETADPAEFLESLRFDLGAPEVYVFTPRGEVIALPTGATPVDFAYAIHTEVGHRTIGARVNGKLVALESALDNGDTVEILTSKAPDAAPSRDWLGFVKSARARNKIRHWFSK
jgi:GTP pyrophosphokinase